MSYIQILLCQKVRICDFRPTKVQIKPNIINFIPNNSIYKKSSYLIIYVTPLMYDMSFYIFHHMLLMVGQISLRQLRKYKYCSFSAKVCFVEKQEKCEKTGKNQFHRYLLNGVDL